MAAIKTKLLGSKNRLLRTMFAGLLSLAMLLACFHGSACETEIRGALPGTVIAEQAVPAQHPVSQHQAADHCMSHLVGDISHPTATVSTQQVTVKLSWRDDAHRPLPSTDSPFKPPRA